jgi:glycosyltransferase involved in cell wall biosynthesis
MKVAFYLDNAGIAEVDLRYPEKGNPGIGGTEYMTVMIANALSKRYGNVMEVSILAANICRLPAACRARHAATFKEAAEQAARNCIDILIFKPGTGSLLAEQISSLESHPTVKAIAWAHNLLLACDWDCLHCSKSIAAVVNVGREQLDFYRDHPLFYKSTVIYNCLDPAAFGKSIKPITTSSRVVYMGCLVEEKGFGILAQAWRKILAQVPHAELHVLGTGRLYGRDSVPGCWGIAEPSFEKKFMPYLLDERGSLLSSVKFHGILGPEKDDLLASAAVGVVNPSGEGESFCISAVEFQAHHVAVVSARDWGLLDTVQHGRTGLLCRNKEELTSNVVKLLKDIRLRTKLGEAAYAFAKAQFQVNHIAPEWNRLLVAVEQDLPLRKISMKPNIFYRNKLTKEIVRRLKLAIPMLKNLPPIENRGLRSAFRALRYIRASNSSPSRPAYCAILAKETSSGQTYHPQTSTASYWAKLLRCAGASSSGRIGEPPNTL